MKSQNVALCAMALRLTGHLAILEWKQYYPLFTQLIQVLNTHLQKGVHIPFQILDASLQVRNLRDSKIVNIVYSLQKL
jgi:hypothetical protein